MISYFVCFAVSCGFTGLASYIKKQKINTIYLILSALAIIFPCLLAGMRDSTVGTDVLVYGDSIYEMALHTPFNSYMKTDVEKLYLLMVYVVTHISESKIFHYFILEICSLLPIYMVLQRDNSSRYAWLGMATYYLMLFPYSLNLLRQSIAVAIVFYGFKFVQKRKFLFYVALVIFAMFFHKTAIIGITIYPIYLLLQKNIEKKYRTKLKFWNKLIDFLNRYGTIISWILIVVSFILVICMRKFIVYFYEYNSDEFAYFYEGIKTDGGIPVIWNYIILVVPVFALYYYNYRYYEYKDKDIRSVATFSAMGVLLYQAATISSEMYRISLYMLFFYPLFIQKMVDLKGRQNKRWAYAFIIVVLCILFFLDFFVRRKWCEIYPYTSGVLGIH